MQRAIISSILLALANPAAMAQTQMGTMVFGPKQIVVIKVIGTVDEIQRDEITRRVPKLMNPGNSMTRYSTDGDTLIVRVAPIDDVKAFAARIDFGTVVSINDRTITVQPAPVAGAGTAAASPLYRALAGIKSPSVDIRHSALEQFALMPPTAQRNEVILALLGPLGSSDSRAKALAIDVLGVWGTKDHVPSLLPVLSSKDADVRRSTIKALQKLKDPAAIEPLAQRLADRQDKWETVEALASFGPAAEPAALRALASPSATARDGACEVLGKVGTRASVAALTAATRDPDTWVRSRATRSLTAVNRRLGYR